MHDATNTFLLITMIHVHLF